VRKKMTTTQYNLIELHSLFNLNQIAALSNEDIEITLDNKHDVSCIQLLTHDEREYFSFINEATNFNDSYWLSDNHIVTISTTEDATTDETTNETTDETTDETTNETTDETTNETTIDAIADLCADLSSNQILKLIGKLSKIAVKNENKKTKKSKPEKTQTEKKDRVSAKNFNYYNLLKSWHGIPTDKIIADGLNGGYSSSVINEDKRVINVLMGTDKDIVISQEWIDYIVNFWHENPDTTWTRLHYAFSKGGRKCSDRGLLCNYIIDNGVSKEDIEAAIASQN
jgi:hypothetical protein